MLLLAYFSKNQQKKPSPQRLGRFRGVELYRVFKGCETLDYLVRVWGMYPPIILKNEIQ